MGRIDRFPVIAGGPNCGPEKRQEDTVIDQSGGKTGDGFSLKLDLS